MSEVTPLFAGQQPQEGPTEQAATPEFVAMIRAVANIAATRILLLIAVLTGSAIWLWTTLDPSRDRLYVAVAFSIVFVLPQTLLYFRRG